MRVHSQLCYKSIQNVRSIFHVHIAYSERFTVDPSLNSSESTKMYLSSLY
jgi:hypothetical protein